MIRMLLPSMILLSHFLYSQDNNCTLENMDPTKTIHLKIVEGEIEVDGKKASIYEVKVDDKKN